MIPVINEFDPQSRPGEPTSRELLARLEKDIAWLQQRGLWTRSMFERAVLRYVEARGSTDGLERFSSRHRVHKSAPGHWIPQSEVPSRPGSSPVAAAAPSLQR